MDARAAPYIISNSPCLFIIIPSVSPLSLRLTFPSAWPRVLSLYRPSFAFSLSLRPSSLVRSLRFLPSLRTSSFESGLLALLSTSTAFVSLATSYLARARIYKRSRFAVRTGDRITKRATCSPGATRTPVALFYFTARAVVCREALGYFS